jgi:nicotinate-nucleotide--dimethylbenzimidazole phosphoribosyltransferase
MLTVAADHEIISEGFASAPPEVTWQQVLNFLNGGGAIGAFCTQVGMKLKVADAGVDHDFEAHPDLYRVKVRKGTRNFLNEHAMTKEECLKAIENGRKIVRDIAKGGCNIIGFGEMGIGNTSPASALLAAYTGMPVEECVGYGAGINDNLLKLKKNTLKAAIAKHGSSDAPIPTLCRFGGLELATIAGGMLEAAALRMVILVDGFITTSAFMVAYEINKTVKDYAITAHASKEQGHKYMIDYMGLTPLLDLNLRLGEGTGAALALPIVQTAVAMLAKMTSFTEAKVFNVSDERLK